LIGWKKEKLTNITANWAQLAEFSLFCASNFSCFELT